MITKMLFGIGATLLLSAAARADFMYVTDSPAGAVDQVSATGQVSTWVTGIANPQGIAVDSNDNVYVVSFGTYNGNGGFNNPAIYKITPNKTKTVFAIPSSNPRNALFDSGGNLLVNHDGGALDKYSPTGQLSTVPNSTIYPFGLAIDPSGNLYIGDQTFSTIYKITPDGQSTLFANIANPTGLAFHNGYLYEVGQSGNAVTRIDSNGTATPFATLPGSDLSPRGLAFDAVGNLYAAELSEVDEITPDGTASVFASGGPFISPQYLTIVTPEPASTVLLGVAFLPMLYRRRGR